MATRKPGDPLPQADPVVHMFYGKRWRVGWIGGRQSKVVQFEVSAKKLIGVTWDVSGDYILVPRQAWSRVLTTGVTQVEFIDESPPHETTKTIWYASRTRVLSYEDWDDGEQSYAAIPRHTLDRFQYLKYGDGMKWRKAQTKKAILPVSVGTCPVWSTADAGSLWPRSTMTIR